MNRLQPLLLAAVLFAMPSGQMYGSQLLVRIEVYADTCESPGRPEGTCNGSPGMFDTGLMQLLIYGRGTAAVWHIESLTKEDEGSTFVANSSTVETYCILEMPEFGQELTDGYDGEMHFWQGTGRADEPCSRGPSGGSGLYESEFFNGAVRYNGEGGPLNIRSTVFVPPPNGIDYEGYVIDELAMTIHTVNVEYVPEHDTTYVGLAKTLEIYGHRIPEPSSFTILALALVTLLPCRFHPGRNKLGLVSSARK